MCRNLRASRQRLSYPMSFDDSTDRVFRQRLTAIALASLALVAWWARWPYLGIQHDALYYTGDALRHLYPGLNRDVFFGIGAQGHVTVFGWLYAQLIDGIGLDMAALWMTQCALVLWAIAFATLCRELFDRPLWAFWFALGLVLPPIYDGIRVLSWAEPFATGRPWAEALSMLAIAAALRLRFWIAFGCIVIAASLHALMGLTGGMVVVFMLQPRIRWLLVSVGIGATFALATLRLGPFAGLFATYDPVWWHVVRDRNPVVFLSKWDATAMARGIGWLFLLYAIGPAIQRDTPSPSRAQQRTTTLAGAILWALSLSLLGAVAAELLKNVLLTSLQLWRILWLAQLLTPLLWLQVLAMRRNWRDARTQWQLLLVVGGVLGDLPINGVLFALAAALQWPPLHAQLTTSPLIKKASYVFAWGTMLLCVVSRLPDLGLYTAFFDQPETSRPWLNGLLCQSTIIVALGSGLALLLMKSPGAVRWLCLVTCIALGGVVACWTAQDTWRAAHPPQEDFSELQRLLPSDAVIYWDRGVEVSWLRLHRAFYASGKQGAGDVFSRPNAMTLETRVTLLKQLGFMERKPTDPVLPPPPTDLAERIRLLCQDQDLDAVVLHGNIERHHALISSGQKSLLNSIFYCSRLRSVPSS